MSQPSSSHGSGLQTSIGNALSQKSARVVLMVLYLVPLWVGVIIGTVSGRWWVYNDGSGNTPPFGDLRWVASWSSCVSRGDYTDAVVDCRIAYPLPSIWVGSLVGFDESDIAWAGILVALVWGVAASCLICSSTWRFGAGWGFFIALSLVGPPTWLLLERANLDALVWPVVLVALVLGTSSGWKQWAGSVGVVMATLMKVFPVGLAAMYLTDLKKKTGRTILLMLAPGLAIAGMAWSSRYVSELRPAPVGDAFGAFHPTYLLRVLLLRLGGTDVSPAAITSQIPVTTLDYVLGVLLFLTGAAVWAFLLRRVPGPPSLGPLSWLLGATGLLLFAYLTGSNFDYRLTFVSMAIVGIAAISHGSATPIGRGILAFLGVALALAPWLSTSMSLAVQVGGDLVLWLALSGTTGLTVVLLVRHWAELNAGTPAETLKSSTSR
jgi:hypothetical protein